MPKTLISALLPTDYNGDVFIPKHDKTVQCLNKQIFFPPRTT